MIQLKKPKSMDPFVVDIFLIQRDEENMLHKNPFYAEGFPGIIYSKSAAPFYLQPRNKRLSDFYLYGQTIEPISLDVQGAFQLLCLRMYPFASKIFLGIDPKVLNDDCYDLRQVKNIDTQSTIDQLNATDDTDRMLEILTVYFEDLLRNASINPDYTIKLAINLILKSGGTLSIKKIRDQLFITERTFERKFLKEVGVTPKQFAKIIQFNSSKKQITETDYVTLTEIGHDNGFADQSHFIRSFKRFTGVTPKEFQKQFSF